MTLTDISIHALRVEGDSVTINQQDQDAIFLSTPSGWRATTREAELETAINISIHALRVEGDSTNKSKFFLEKISIHALRVEGDIRLRPEKGKKYGISIHALRVEGDPLGIVTRLAQTSFLSTPSGWRATKAVWKEPTAVYHHFYPRPPGGGRRQPEAERTS